MKTHWLFGIGPNKELHFKKEIDIETKCTDCAHCKVCSHNMTERCVNYKFGRSDVRNFSSCESCTHKYTRYDKEAVPCFHCEDFLPIGAQS